MTMLVGPGQDVEFREFLYCHGRVSRRRPAGDREPVVVPRRTLERLNREGRTIIMVTHEVEIAKRAKRQIYIIFVRNVMASRFGSPYGLAAAGAGLNNVDSRL